MKLHTGIIVVGVIVLITSCQSNNTSHASRKVTPAKLLASNRMGTSNISELQNSTKSSEASSRVPQPFPVVASNRQQTVVTANNSLEQLFAAFKSPTQFFVLSSDQDTVIVGQQGTRVHVAWNDFVAESGQKLSGLVEISLVECYSPLEMFAHQLSTHTTDKRILETGGSVQILAKSGGVPVQLKPGHVLQVDFPVKSAYQEGMEEFIGVPNPDGTVVWEVANSVDKTNEIAATNPPVSSTSKQERTDGGYFMKNGNAYTTKVSVAMKTNLKSTLDLADLPTVEKDQTFGAFMGTLNLINSDLDQFFRDNKTIEVSLYFNMLGKVKDVTSTRIVPTSIKEDLLRLFRKAPPVVMKTIRTNVAYPITLESRRITSANSIVSSAAYGTTETNKEEMKLYELYSLQVNWLGWVNCDRFLKDTRTKVNIGAKLGLAATVFLICKRIKSRMFPGNAGNGLFTFANLPVGEPVRLVAIKVEGDHYYLETMDIEVSQQQVPFTFDPKTPTTKEGIVEAFKL